MRIGRLKPVEIRALWANEERHFTPWLAQNIDLLSEALGFQLEVTEREKRVGSFELDLLATDGQDRIIIENQLEMTDHSHLGQLLIYLTNLDAKRAVWIVRDARPEYVRAVQWLNEVTPDDIRLYLVKIEAFQIGDSDPAAHFSVVVRPTIEGKSFGHERKHLAEEETRYQRFWGQFLTRAQEHSMSLLAGKSPGKQSWLGVPTGLPDVWYELGASSRGVRVQLSVYTPDKERNLRILRSIEEARESVQRELGPAYTPQFEPRESQRGSYVVVPIADRVRWDDEATWPAIQERMIDAMGRLVRAVAPHIATFRDDRVGAERPAEDRNVV